MFHKLSGKFTQCNPKTEHREMATYQLQTTGEQTDEAMRRALRPQNAMQGDKTASGAYVLTNAEGKAFDPQTSASAVLMGDGTTLEKKLEDDTTRDEDKLSLLAHSDCTLEERVTHLERLLVEMLSGKVLIPELQVKKLGVWGDNNLVVTGEGAPTKAPDRAGQFYVDTKNNAVYHSVGNGAVSDWKNA